MSELRSRLRRVGHKGADLIAPGNTYASFDAALEAGVDMIEFDVLPERDGDRLMVAHDYEDAGGRAPHTLEETLAHLASDAFSRVELDVDLKLPGYELRVLDALRDAGLLDAGADRDASTRMSLELLRAAEPDGEARVVGAEADARPVPLARDAAAGVRRAPGVPARPSVARRARDTGSAAAMR